MRAAFGSDKSVDLGRQAAAGTAHAAIVPAALSMEPPCWWTRTHEASIMTMSPS